MSLIDFEVGKKYENEKGEYEVLSIDKNTNTMAIRWNSGEETTTKISIQRRIFERRRIEKAAAEHKAKQPTRRTNKSFQGKSKFSGFKESDFSEDIKGTAWRSRKALGGAVTSIMDSDGLRINSWSVYPLPQIHWKDVKQHGIEGKWLQAKFFFRLDTENGYYGFYIERPDDESRKNDDWNYFMNWLESSRNESWLREVSEERGLCFYDRWGENRSFVWEVTAADGTWWLYENGNKKSIDSLRGFLNQIPFDNAVDLQIAKVVPRPEIIELGQMISEDIASIFETLMPLYRAAISKRPPNNY